MLGYISVLFFCQMLMLESVQNYFFFLSFITIHKVHGAKLSYSQQVPTTHGLLMTALSCATLLPIF